MVILFYGRENAFTDGGENRENNFNRSNSIVLIDSEKTPIVACLDGGPVNEPPPVEYIYDYTANFTLDDTSHTGLDFYQGRIQGPMSDRADRWP